MVLMPHMLVGAIVGSRMKNIWSVFVLSLASHYFLDFLPHWDYLNKIDPDNLIHLTKIGIDVILGFALVIILSLKYSRKTRELIFFGAGVAIFPDFLNFIHVNLKLEWLKTVVDFHNLIHYWTGLSFWQGFSAAIIVIFAAIIILKRKWG